MTVDIIFNKAIEVFDEALSSSHYKEAVAALNLARRALVDKYRLGINKEHKPDNSIALERVDELRREDDVRERYALNLPDAVRGKYVTAMTISILNDHGIYTVGDIVNSKKDELLKIKGIGEKRINNIARELRKIGVDW